ncbi:MAG: universal stress protein [Caldilineaceae bacterium]
MSITYKKILVPLDGSQLAGQALPYAEELARHTGATLILLQVVDDTTQYLVTPTGFGPTRTTSGVAMSNVDVIPINPDTDAREHALEGFKQMLDRLAAVIRQHAIKVETSVTAGRPAEEIVDQAVAHEVDLIVMSTHGRNGLGHWTFGSVTNKVLQAAPCPVMVVRPTME